MPPRQISLATSSRINGARSPSSALLVRVPGYRSRPSRSVISGATSVSPEARARVMEAIRKHDYQLNAAARALRTKRSALGGPSLVPGIRHIFYSTIAEVLEKDLRAQGISLLIATSGGSADGELLALNSLRSHGADAYVLSLVDEEDDRCDSSSPGRLATDSPTSDRVAPRCHRRRCTYRPPGRP